MRISEHDKESKWSITAAILHIAWDQGVISV